MGKTKILIYDSINDGHHLDYLFYIIQQVSLRPNLELIVVCHEKITKNLHDFSFPIQNFPQISFFYLQPNQIQNFHSKNIFNRSLSEWNFAVEIAQKNLVDHIVFPYFDYFQIGAIFGKKPTCNVSGILFGATSKNSWYTSIKKTILATVLKKPFLKNIFLVSNEYYNAIKNTSKKILFLPDPIYTFPFNPKTKEHTTQNLHIPPNKTCFLNFGHLDSRKGILEFLSACELLDPDQQKQIHLILAGKLDPKIKPAVEKKIASLQISTTLLFHYLMPEEIQYLFEATDWSLVLYPKFMGNASTLVRSAMAKKPLIANKYGNIGYLMQKHELGIALNPENSKEIANALTDILQNNRSINPKNLEEFAQFHQVNHFGKLLLETISQNI